MKITKEEFIERLIESVAEYGNLGCPSELGLKELLCLDGNTCEMCWRKAIKKGVE